MLILILKQSKEVIQEPIDGTTATLSLIDVLVTVAATPPVVDTNTTCHPKQLPRWERFI